LLSDNAARSRLEAKIRRGYEPVTWHSVAKKVVAACQSAAGVVWPEPYPYTSIPYSSEVNFGKLDRDIDGTGEAVLARIERTRRGLFLGGLLQEQNFLWGEEIRSHGYWAYPEDWGTWACHAGGDIAVALAPSDSLLFDVFLRVRVSGLLTDQPIRLSANGRPVWNAAIGEGPRNIHFRVRKQNLGTGSFQRRLRDDQQPLGCRPRAGRLVTDARYSAEMRYKPLTWPPDPNAADLEDGAVGQCFDEAPALTGLEGEFAGRAGCEPEQRVGRPPDPDVPREYLEGARG